MLKELNPFYIIGGIICVFLLSLLYFLVQNLPEEQLQKAFDSYVSGENAVTVVQRQENFNRALSIYTDLEKSYAPDYGNGKLYYNIANAYFQLENYPQALLYYYRALKLAPNDSKMQQNLATALQQLKLPKAEPEFSYITWNIALPKRLQLFFASALLLLFFLSAYLWLELAWLKNLAILCGVGALLLLLSVGYSRYLSPIEAVMMRSTAMYRDAGTQYAKVSEEPVLSGSKVVVLDVLQEGRWLKIKTPDGKFGYVQQEAIRLI